MSFTPCSHVLSLTWHAKTCAPVRFREAPDRNVCLCIQVSLCFSHRFLRKLFKLFIMHLIENKYEPITFFGTKLQEVGNPLFFLVALMNHKMGFHMPRCNYAVAEGSRLVYQLRLFFSVCLNLWALLHFCIHQNTVALTSIKPATLSSATQLHRNWAKTCKRTSTMCKIIS